MTAIFKEKVIEWDGEEVTLRATMRTINKIEQTVSLAQLAQRISAGDVPLSHLATVYGCLLRDAGVTITDDDVYASMYGAGDYDQEGLMNAAVGALECVFPANTGGSRKAKLPKKAKR